MSTLRTAGTAPELALRRELHRRGLRFRVNVRELPGRPDIVLSRARVAVFVDGCFWHSCPEHAVAPKANREWWQDKLRMNRKRDEQNDASLRDAGWVVIRAWEHEDLRSVAARVERVWRDRTNRSH